MDDCPDAAQPTCPKCTKAFTPSRLGQTYCSKACQKAATHNAARQDRTKETKAMNAKHIAIITHLNHLVFAAPRDQQLGAMKRVLDTATEQDITIKAVYGDSTDTRVVPTIHRVSPADIRRVLTDPRLLRANRFDGSQGHLFHGGRPKTISQAAHEYTKKFFGLGIKEYLKAARVGEVEGIELQRPAPKGVPEVRMTEVRDRAQRFSAANGFEDLFPDSWADEVVAYSVKTEWTEAETQSVNDILHSVAFECGQVGLLNWLRHHGISVPLRIAA